MVNFSTACGINGTFYIKIVRISCSLSHYRDLRKRLGLLKHIIIAMLQFIIKINEFLIKENLVTNVTETNEHSNVTTFVCALIITQKDVM